MESLEFIRRNVFEALRSIGGMCLFGFSRATVHLNIGILFIRSKVH